MFKYILLMMIVVTVGGSGVMYYAQSLYQSSLIMQNNMIGMAAINQLKSSSINQNGRYYLPFGLNDSDHHQLPMSFVGARTTQMGVPLVYCPYAPNEVTSSNDVVLTSSSESYEILKNTTLSPLDKEYVIESENSPVSGMIGAIIIPKKKLALPKCSDITINERGQFTLQNESAFLGTVFGLMESDLVFTGEYEINEYVEESGEGEDLQSVLTRVAQNPSKSAVITLKQGQTFTLSDSFTLESAHKFKHRHVVIKSDNPQNPVSITALGSSYIQWKDIDVSLDGVVFSNLITNESQRANVSMSNVSTARWVSKESELSLDDVSFGVLNSTLPAIELYQSKVSHLSGQVSLQGAGSVVAALEGGSWNTDGGDVSLNMNGASFGIQVDAGNWSHRRGSVFVSGSGSPTLAMFSGPESSVRFSNLTWEQSSSTDYSIYVSGHAYITDSNIKTGSNSNVGIHTDAGAVLRLNNSVIGTSSSKPNIGLTDNGATSISGNATVYATTCTAQGLYDDVSDIKVVYDYAYMDGGGGGGGGGNGNGNGNGGGTSGQLRYVPKDAIVEQPVFSEYFQRATINCL
jgi:hypothetical protein